jgi:hypothetical protein
MLERPTDPCQPGTDVGLSTSTIRPSSPTNGSDAKRGKEWLNP